MKLLSLLFRHSPGVVVLAILAGVAGGASNAALLAMANTAIHTPEPWTHRRLLWGFIALCLLLPATRAVSSYFLTVLGQRTVLKLRTDLAAKILAAPLRQLEHVGSHKLLATLTQDVASIVAATAALPVLSVQAAIVLGCLGYLAWLSLPAFGAVVVFLAVGIVTYQIPVSYAMRLNVTFRETTDRLYDHFRAITGGIKELKLHTGRRDDLMRHLTTTGERLKGLAVRVHTVYSGAAGWGQLVIFALVGVTVFGVPAFAEVDVKALTGYALILLYMMTPLEMILESTPTLARADVAFRKVESLGLSLGDEAPAPPVAAPSSRTPWSTLELAGVTHTYQREGEDSRFSVGPLDLSLRPGEVVFLVGGNGSGKTTLAKLVTGLYAPDGGEVRVDGKPVTDATREAYMQRFSVIFSDFFLFESLLGLDAAGRDEAADGYLRRLQLQDKVKVTDGMLSTTSLSQGQRKRLALLTAYLEDRDIYLFDEWAADQDPVFKEVFYHEILPELKARGKTLLVISHDDHYYGVADRIIKLDYGRVEYDGGPARFLAGAAAGGARRSVPA